MTSILQKGNKDGIVIYFNNSHPIELLPSIHSWMKFLHAFGASFDHNSISISPAVVLSKTYKHIDKRNLSFVVT